MKDRIYVNKKGDYFIVSYYVMTDYDYYGLDMPRYDIHGKVDGHTFSSTGYTDLGYAINAGKYRIGDNHAIRVL